jgi:hypothetical protein
MSSYLKIFLVPILPVVFFVLALPAVEKASDVFYFFGSAFGVIYMLISNQEPTIVYWAMATLPILCLPAICYSVVKYSLSLWVLVIFYIFSIANGVLGLLVMYGRWC